MGQVKEEEIINKEVQQRFGCIDFITNIWRRRQLLFIECIVRLDEGMYPLILLMATVKGR